MSFFSLNLLSNALGLVLQEKNVAIYYDTDEVLNGIFLFESTILDIEIVEDSQLMEHPIETGAKITDHTIFNPVEINLRLCMPSYLYTSIYKELETFYRSKTKLRIKSKMKWYNRMLLQGLPHQEKAENVSRVVFDLHFKEVLEVLPQAVELERGKVKNADNSSTSKLGENVNKTETSSSMLYDIFN